jgi:hypothetical protein
VTFAVVAAIEPTLDGKVQVERDDFKSPEKTVKASPLLALTDTSIQLGHRYHRDEALFLPRLHIADGVGVVAQIINQDVRSISSWVAIIRPKATVPFAAQIGNGWEIGPVFPHATRLLQQTQSILGLELRNQLLDGVVN